jgi:pentatricopeptide repeat protein
VCTRRLSDAMSVYQMMRSVRRTCMPNNETFSILIHYLLSVGDGRAAQSLFSEMEVTSRRVPSWCTVVCFLEG